MFPCAARLYPSHPCPPALSRTQATSTPALCSTACAQDAWSTRSPATHQSRPSCPFVSSWGRSLRSVTCPHITSLTGQIATPTRALSPALPRAAQPRCSLPSSRWDSARSRPSVAVTTRN
ncbi:hypothetical protein T492DRAFT_1029543 [Pavlovales sp. CCMP2436]|nr:hypothetical protein T492DRAFT_1029543 [Pavlovales sp. CCMP2436]